MNADSNAIAKYGCDCYSPLYLNLGSSNLIDRQTLYFHVKERVLGREWTRTTLQTNSSADEAGWAHSECRPYVSVSDNDLKHLHYPFQQHLILYLSPLLRDS